jgi:hypothetical protein
MKSNFLFFLISLTFFTSCRKTESDSLKRLVRSDHLIGTSSYFKTYEYDSQGRLILINSDIGIIERYEYTDSKVTYTYNEGLENASVNYYLNSQGLVEKSVVTNVDGTTDTQSLQYNSNNNVIRSERVYSDGGKTVETKVWVDGNNVSQVIHSYFVGLNNPIVHSTDNTFLYDRKNTLGNDYKGLNFLGKSSSNPVSVRTTFNPNGSQTIYELLYQFDNEGFIIGIGSDTYTYE